MFFRSKGGTCGLRYSQRDALATSKTSWSLIPECCAMQDNGEGFDTHELNGGAGWVWSACGSGFTYLAENLQSCPLLPQEPGYRPKFR